MKAAGSVGRIALGVSLGLILAVLAIAAGLAYREEVLLFFWTL